MHSMDTRSLPRRWLDASFGMWGRLAPAAATISALLRALAIALWATLSWASVVTVPALVAIPTVALLGGWLAIMTHNWNLSNAKTPRIVSAGDSPD